MNAPSGPLPPAFYAVRRRDHRSAWADWWVLLHAPYTLWHLSYVGIGAALAPHFDGATLLATAVAFFLAVGIGAHALDELKGRPLRTSVPSSALVAVAVASISGSVVLGVLGIEKVGRGLVVFIVVGVLLNCAYNLELFRGRLHNGVTFAAAWGAFPVLTAYYAQARTVDAVAITAAMFAFALSIAQRALSSPARTLRRGVDSFEGRITYVGGRDTSLSRSDLLAPLESALKALTWSVFALVVALITYRINVR